METVRNPHDKLFHEIYSHKEEAQSFLEQYLPPEVLRQIDSGSLEISKDSFIDEDLKDFYSDLLYKVTLHGELGYVYVLFEHKSYPDRLIHLQLLEYMLKIWRQHLKQRSKEKPKKRPIHLPIIMPLVLYHGEQEWPYCIKFSDMLIGPTESLAAYIPDFSVLLTDLTAYPDSEIKGTILSRVVLLLFKHIFDKNLQQTLPNILYLMRELLQQERGLQYIELFLRYLCSATDNITNEELVNMAQKAIAPEGGNVVMTIAERWLQQGIEQGIERGIKRGREEGVVIGEILFAQKIMKLTVYDRAELERKGLDELKEILTKMEAQIQQTENNEQPE